MELLENGMADGGGVELIWSGKRDAPAVAPGALVSAPDLSYRADGGLGDNRLIHGDNLPALIALTEEFAGRIKCVYIDPPYNTGAAFEHYGDGVAHAAWLSAMRARLLVLRELLSPEGVLFVHIDDKELAYLRILADEVFGRENFLNMVVVKTSDPSGHKTVNPSPYSQTEYLLMYARERKRYIYDVQYIPCEYDRGYNHFVLNREKSHTEWSAVPLAGLVAERLGYRSATAAARAGGGLDFRRAVADFALEHAASVFQSTVIGDAAGKEIVAARDYSAANPGAVVHVPRKGHPDVYVLNGRQMYFYANKVKVIDGVATPAKPLTNIWTDIPWNGIAGEGGVRFKNGKKPEKLLRRCLALATAPGDWVLDAFAGSGTTGAVAHKMGRRWIMIESGDQCRTHIVPRMRAVVDGVDDRGVTKATGWLSGGGWDGFCAE